MPFEIDPLWQGLSLPANGNHLFGVEWGRAAQLRAFPGDSETLARIASVISMHFLALHGRLTGRNSVVYVQSARPANTRLYQEGLSLNLLANQNGLSLLGNPLDEVIGRIKPEESLLGLARLRELFPEVHSESLIRWLIGLAEGVRLDFDLYEHNGVNWLSRMPLGPVILRDLSPFARERIREMVRPLEREWSPHRSEELVDFVMSHLRHSSLRDPFYFRDDFPRVATEWENGISPIVVSNLETQPDVKAILRIIYDKYLRGMGNSSHFPTVEIAVVTRNDSVAIELLGTGLFREISPSGRVRRFLARLSTLSQLSVNQQYQLRDGYWMRNRLLHELPGL